METPRREPAGPSGNPQAESTHQLRDDMAASRYNLRLRGIPESTEAENVGDIVLGIFRTVLDDQEAVILLDRAHRALGPRPTDPSRPRDVICRLHRYTQRETILRQA